MRDTEDTEPADGWPTEEWPAVTSRRADSWLLACGGIAAAAAFAAAFVAAGGTSSHPATPAYAVPAAASQACPSAAP
jgi:hypothetical protein